MSNTYQRMVLTLPVTTTQFVSKTNLHDGLGPHEGFQGVINYLTAINGGVQQGKLVVTTGEVYAYATLTVSSTGSTNGETMSIANVTLTAVSGAPNAGEFQISTTPSVQAENMASAINENAGGAVDVSVSGAVVTVTAKVPGAIGNGIQISESLTNVALVAFAHGADGDTFTMDLL